MPNRLNDRDREVARLLVQDLSAKQIARMLGRSRRTIEDRRARIFAVLQVRGIGGLARLLARRGWLEDAPWPASEAATAPTYKCGANPPIRPLD